MKLYTVAETSELIGKKITTIYKDLGRRPWALPPRHKIPNCRAVYFRDAPEWVAGDLPPVPKPRNSYNRRGRPSHASRLAANQ